MRKLWTGLILLVMAGFTLFIIAFLLPLFLTSNYSIASSSVSTTTKPEIPAVIHLATPESLKALYMTACVANTPSWRDSLKKLIETTELNAVVVDIKDYSGIVSFPNDFPQTGVERGCVVSDMREFIEELHGANIYVIGRISVFQDFS